MSFINVQMINSNLNLDSKDINSDIDNIIKMKLKEKVEGKIRRWIYCRRKCKNY